MERWSLFRVDRMHVVVVVSRVLVVVLEHRLLFGRQLNDTHKKNKEQQHESSPRFVFNLDVRPNLI